MSEKRYGYCDEIASIVDMSKLTIEGGEEMTTCDVVERLNQLEAKLTAIECGDCGLTMLECACDDVEEEQEDESIRTT